MTEKQEANKKYCEFLQKLRDLLSEYNVEITADDEWEGYSECGEDIQINIEANFDYPFFIDDVKFGKYITAESL